MIETGETEDSATRQKVQMLGKSPELLQTKAVASAEFMEQAFSAMQACTTRIAETGGLNSLKDVRVQYRSQDGLALFRQVKDLDKARSRAVM